MPDAQTIHKDLSPMFWSEIAVHPETMSQRSSTIQWLSRVEAPFNWDSTSLLQADATFEHALVKLVPPLGLYTQNRAQVLEGTLGFEDVVKPHVFSSL